MKRSIAIVCVAAAVIALPVVGCGKSVVAAASVTEASTPITVPVAGNSYLVEGAAVSIPVVADGTFTLSDPTSVVEVWFRVGCAGRLDIEVLGAASASVVNISINRAPAVDQDISMPEDSGCRLGLVMPGGEIAPHKIPSVDMPEGGGYICVRFEKVYSLDGSANEVRIAGLRIGGPATLGTNNFCTVGNLANRADNWALWARRGPSVHMNYAIGAESEYFYNELTVPVGEDVVASYFMTNGFGEGYCGFQVNSDTERRILFSVWSPYTTDDPHTIPADQEVVLAKRGPGVRAQDFGGEGSGGQSYLVYPWRAGVTYKVLTRVRYHGPSGFETFPFLNEYTAWFFDPEQDSWRLVAQWRRPDKTKKTYTRAHSFLENFSPSQGYITREVGFGNQWTCSTSGVWTEVTEATFTNDNTARQGLRADYQGGVKENRFVLKNCGFFDLNTPRGTVFTRAAGGPSAQPAIDFDALEKLPVQ